MAHNAARAPARRAVLSVALLTMVGAGLLACSSDEVVYEDENLARELSLAETLEELPEELPSDSGSARHTDETLRSSYVTAPQAPRDELQPAATPSATRDTPAPTSRDGDADGFVSNVSDPLPGWRGR